MWLHLHHCLILGLPAVGFAANFSLGSYRPSITPVEHPTPSVPAYNVFSAMTRNMWTLFWKSDQKLWNVACDGSGTASLWDVSVAGDISMYLWDYEKTLLAAKTFENYLNPQLGAFSASTNKDNDVYTDDNAQVVFALLSAYAQHPTREILKQMRDVLNFLVSQVNPKTGGITWHYGLPYVALISTLEAAMAAMRVHYYVRDATYLNFAKTQMLWILENLLDPNDHFIWDGIDSNSKNIDKGKLSYHEGLAMSVMALLSRNDKSQDWQSMAVEIAVRSLGAGKLDSIFFSNGHLSNEVKYSHHFIGGLADLITVTSPRSTYEADAYAMINAVIARESRYLYDLHESTVIKSTTCPALGGYNSLLNYASLANVFWQAGKTVTFI